MKVRLVVNQGPQKGKEIPVSTSSKFTIGRGEGCQLRPASQAISKKHCTIEVRDDKCFLEDLNSTNGTFVNNEQLQGEREVSNGDMLKIGPLEFVLKLVVQAPAAPAPTPIPEPAVEPPTKKVPAVPAAKKPAPKPAKTPSEGVDEEDVAAMLLDLDDDASAPVSTPTEEEEEVAGGSTIMDILLPQKETSPAPAPYRPKDANKPGAQANTSNAAKEILEKYRRRPRT